MGWFRDNVKLNIVERPIRYCEDCRFYKLLGIAGMWGDELSECLHPRAKRPPTTLVKRMPDRFQATSDMRAVGWPCGISADLFQPKEPKGGL